MMNEWIISSSLLIAAVLIGRRLLRGRISLRLQYALWAVVLLRLLLPIQLYTSSFGAGTVAQTVDIAQPVRQVYASAREDDYEREYDIAYSQVVAEYQASGQSYEPVVAERKAAAQAKQAIELDLNKLLYGVWFAGMAVMTAVIAACNLNLGLRLKRRRWELPVSDCILPVYITEAVPTPCIFGLFRPTVYLTPDAAGDERVRSHVLAHELTHYRHMDHIWSVLRSVCLILHWYNPLVWLAAKVSRADAELACDEGALVKLGEEQRGDYGRTLIGLTCSAPIGDLFVAATTMTGSAGSIRERIKLLMKRPRNTVLALIAVVLIGTVIVGCTFAGAPETGDPAETTAPTEPDADTPDNDMSYQGQELPIPENPGVSDFLTEDGLLIFPGTRWGMTEAELLDALDIQEYGLFSGLRGIHLPQTTFCGYPASIGFYFDRYRDEDEWGLAGVRVQLQDEEAASGVYRILYEQLGRFDFETSGVNSCVWLSDTLMEDMISPEAYAIYQENRVETAFSGAASSIAWFGSGISEQENIVSFSSNVGLARQIEASMAPDPTDTAQKNDPAEEIAALFGPDGLPMYRSALALTYTNANFDFDLVEFFSAGGTAVTLTDAEKALVTEVYGADAVDKTVFRMDYQMVDEVLEFYVGTDSFFKDMSEFLFCPETQTYLLVREDVPERHYPQIQAIDVDKEGNWAYMTYTLPSSEQQYVATLLKGENWKVYSNQYLVTVPAGARGLTAEEVTRVKEAFAPYNAPLSAFLLDIYDDISEMSRSNFLSYYPATETVEEEAEFQLLKKKYPEAFEIEQSIRDMNWPIHRVHAEDVEELVAKYTLVRWDDLPYDGWHHYLEETDCYYTYYSDVGLFGFPCTGGWVYDGGAMLVSNNTVLYLTEQKGKYYIQAHIPAIVFSTSSNPMIPADG